jgi:hypothetical protein
VLAVFELIVVGRFFDVTPKKPNYL